MISTQPLCRNYYWLERCIWYFMYAILQCGLAAGYCWIPTWRSANTEYRIFGEFQENAQEPSVCVNIQSGTQSTGLSDFQLNKASFGTFWLSRCPHEPTLSPSATPSASTSSMVKVSLPSPLSSISKQGTTNGRCRKSSRPCSAKGELEKKRGVKFTDTQETNLSEIPLRET